MEPSRSDGNGGTELFDATTGDRLDFPHPFRAVQFGPPGTWFLTVDETKTIHKHDQITGETIGEPMVGHQRQIAWFVADPTARHVASVGQDGAMRVWDLETTTQVGREITRATQALGNWSGDGRWLTVPVGSSDPTAPHLEVWNFDTDTWPDLACQLAGRNLAEDEWEQLGPRTIDRRATCPCTRSTQRDLTAPRRSRSDERGCSAWPRLPARRRPGSQCPWRHAI